MRTKNSLPSPWCQRFFSYIKKKFIVLHLSLWSAYIFLNYGSLSSCWSRLAPRQFISHTEKDQEICDDLSQFSGGVKEDSYSEEHSSNEAITHLTMPASFGNWWVWALEPWVDRQSSRTCFTPYPALSHRDQKIKVKSSFRTSFWFCQPTNAPSDVSWYLSFILPLW